MKRFPILSISVLAFLFSCSSANSQSKEDPRHEIHYRAINIDNDDLKIEFENAHSQQVFTHVKLVVTNKTTDFILVKTSEILFKYDFGEYHPDAKGLFSGENLLLGPGEKGARTLKVTGSADFHVEKLTVQLKGFYAIASSGIVEGLHDFQLPPATNVVVSEKLSCSLERIKKETKETEASFNCQYTGKNAIIVNPSKISLKLENGKVFANDNRKTKPSLLFPNEEDKLTVSFHVPAKIVDMQFANMLLQWNDTFTESKPKPVSISDVNLLIDPGLTDGKNR